jgi:hypothetical protein
LVFIAIFASDLEMDALIALSAKIKNYIIGKNEWQCTDSFAPHRISHPKKERFQ